MNKRRLGNVSFKMSFYILLILVSCYSTKVISSPNKYDLMFIIVDQSQNERPIPSATVIISGTLPDWYVGNSISLLSSPGGYVAIQSVPEGMKNITVIWKSRYNPREVVIYYNNIYLNKTTDIMIFTTVYDAELQFVTLSGKPVVGAEVRLAGVLLGLTSKDGEVNVTQVPSLYMQTSQPYPVKVTWLGVDISPDDVIIEATKIYILTVKDMGPLVVQVVDAHRQGLKDAKVDISKAGKLIYSVVTNEQGMVSVEVPFGTYDIRADYKGFTSLASVVVNSLEGTVQILANDVYFEVFDMAISYTSFILILILVVVIIILSCLFIIFRRRQSV